jgi:choline dehydrogenase-like flavoprotein
MLQRALTSGRAVLRPQTFAVRLVIEGGRARGVELLDEAGHHWIEPAGSVVVAAGAIETPRLLLLSGVEHALLGRFAMFHFQTYVAGHLADRLHAHRGRAVTHIHDDHLVASDASRRAATAAGLPWIKGGMVEHAGASLPIAEAKLYPWGQRHRATMTASPLRDHLAALIMQGEDLAQPGNRVDLDPTVRDARGIPVARVTYRPHRHELVASDHYAQTLTDVLKAAGAEWAVTATSPMTSAPYGGPVSPIPSSRHAMGTARSGRDPTTAVCDPWGRLFGAPNVHIADSSVFPSASGYGPTLTIVALALRSAAALVETT